MGRMPTEKWTPERRRQQTRDALVDAAAEVFARRGFEGASLDEIAETAGFTRGAIYKNFGGKEDLFLAVHDRLNEREVRQFAALRHDGDVDFEGTVKLWRDSLERNRDYSLLAAEFRLYALRHPELHDKVAASFRATVEMVAAFIDEQVALGAAPLGLPPEDLAGIFVTVTDGFNDAAPFDPDAERRYRLVLELLVKALQT
jgi:AcrR family transcriptional regulator